MRTEIVELPQFDLSDVMAQVARINPDWARERLAYAEGEYRKFLYLSKAHPQSHLVPSKIVDEVWHRHILNTNRYAADCIDYFGYFLHHNPNDSGAVDQVAWQETAALYAQVFGAEMFIEKGASGCDGGNGVATCETRTPATCETRTPATCETRIAAS